MYAMRSIENSLKKIYTYIYFVIITSDADGFVKNNLHPDGRDSVDYNFNKNIFYRGHAR